MGTFSLFPVNVLELCCKLLPLIFMILFDFIFFHAVIGVNTDVILFSITFIIV